MLHFGLRGSLVPHRPPLSQGYGSQCPFSRHGCFACFLPSSQECLSAFLACLLSSCSFVVKTKQCFLESGRTICLWNSHLQSVMLVLSLTVQKAYRNTRCRNVAYFLKRYWNKVSRVLVAAGIKHAVFTAHYCSAQH